jgi:eukaryotic-like serine/threonine-protein kinase
MADSPKNWERVKEILAQALELAAARRGEFIRDACGADHALRAEVESLAAHHDRADSLLEDSILVDLDAICDAMVGRKLGAYRITRRIGDGGMAVVYFAERDDDFRRSVAIKMVKPGPHSAEILQRFRNERQTLAAIDHPNIVKLLDGGNTQEGWPYLVMDYVDGLPIDRYCDLHRLSIDKRLRLFCTVCSAVQCAHGKSIIHRDIKPENVFVTQEGVVRLLDFGIAKLLSPELFRTALITRTSLRPMTPEYASPEQIRGQPVTQASDVYSLGVLLYVLLTGHKPYGAAGRSLVEVERAICEEEAELPSVVVARSAAQSEPPAAKETAPQSDEGITAPERVARNRGLDPRQLRRRLRGDLDTVALKALRKEPTQRYASALDLSGDIERHLRGEPIAARPLTLAYRGLRFARRHQESIVTAAILVAVTTGLTLWEMDRTLRPVSGLHVSSAVSGPRPTVAVLGFKNLSARADAAWISTALSEMLDAELGAGDRLRMVPAEIVARRRIDLEIPETQTLAPDTLARVRKYLGSDFIVLGSYLDLRNPEGEQIRLDLRLQNTERGETVAAVSEIGSGTDLLALVSSAGRKLRQQMGVEAVSLLESTGVRASVPSNPDAMRLYAEGLTRLRAFDALAARDLLLRAVAADPSYPLAHSMLSRAWMGLGYREKSIDEARKALDLASKLSRADHALVEAHFYETRQDWDKAIETYQALFSAFPDALEYGLDLANAQVEGERGGDALRTVARLRTVSAQANDDPRVDLTAAEAAYSLADSKRVVLSAETAIRKASASGATLVAARARVIQCRAYASLGQAELSKAAGAEARRLYHQGGDLSGEAQALHAMAEVPIDQGDLQQAKQLYTEALDLARQVGDKRSAARELGNIGLIFVQEGDFATGEKMYASALENFREVGDRWNMAVVIGNTGDIRHAEGRLGEALAEYRDALTLAREVGQRSSEGIDLQLIGDVLADQGDLDGAMQMYQQSSTIQREIDDKYYYSTTLLSIGHLHRQRGDSKGAKSLYEEALALRRALGAKGMVAEVQIALGELAGDTGDGATEESWVRQAAREFQAEREEDNEVEAQRLLIEASLEQGKLAEATAALKAGLPLYGKSKDVTIRLPFQIEYAYALAATGQGARARELVEQARLQAQSAGLARIELEAELAQCQIRMKANGSPAARAALAVLAKDSRGRGFELIAQKAGRALERARLKPT